MTDADAAPAPPPAPVLDTLDAALAHWTRRGALLGLDLGTKTLGVAVADPSWTVATALETIARRKFSLDAERLERLATERKVVGVVLGLPRNMDGGEGPRAQSTRAFARNLAKRPFWAAQRIPIAFWDERLSTAAVERALLAADATRARRAAVVDRMAAAYILDGALDRLRELSARGDGSEPR